MYHSLMGSCNELVKSVQENPKHQWAAALCSRVSASMAAVKQDLSPFQQDFMLMDSKDIKKKYGENDTMVQSKILSDTLEPKLNDLEQAKAKLLSHMRVG